MKWIDDGNEMRFFGMQRDISYVGEMHRIFSLYNIRTGAIFFKMKAYVSAYERRYECEALEFFEPVKDRLREMILRDFVEGEAYSYAKWLLPLFREQRLGEIGI